MDNVKLLQRFLGYALRILGYKAHPKTKVGWMYSKTDELGLSGHGYLITLAGVVIRLRKAGETEYFYEHDGFCTPEEIYTIVSEAARHSWPS